MENISAVRKGLWYNTALEGEIMRKVLFVLILLFTVQANAVALTQGVCVDKDLAAHPEKYKCWYGTNGNDTMEVRGKDIGLAVRDSGAFTFIGIYDSKHTHYFYGRNGDDEIRGGDQADVIFGGSGHDMIFGGKGNDFLYGDTGADTLYGEEGNDFLQGGPLSFPDFLSGGAGDDTLDGGNGTNGLFGGPGNDSITMNAKETSVVPDDNHALGYTDFITVYGAKSKSEIYITNQQLFDSKDQFTFIKDERYPKPKVEDGE